MADSPVLYVYYRPDNDDSYPGVPNRHITEADWARFSPSQRRTVEQATTQEGYTRRKVWVHRDLLDETEQERADREAAEQAARDAYERGQSIVRWRDFEPLVPGPGEVIVGTPTGTRQQLATDPRIMRPINRVLMRTLPTITEMTAGATGGGFMASSIANPSPRYNAVTSDVFRYFGGVAEPGTGTNVETNSMRGKTLSQSGARGSFNVDFETDADTIEIATKGGGIGTVADVFVNGEMVRATPLVPTLTAGAFYNWKIEFDNTDPKHIRIESSGTFYFSGVYVPATSSVWRSTKPLGPRVVFYTDSIGGTAGIADSADRLRVIPRVICEHLGWINYGISATGSTGFANPGNSDTFEARMDADLVPYDPEILVLIVGQNDAGTYASQSEAAARSFLTRFTGLFPGVPVYLIGPYTANPTVLGGHATVRDGYVKMAKEFATVTHIDPLGGGAAGATDTGWITTANASVAIGSDTLHPTRRGAAVWGSRAAAAIESSIA